MKFVYSCHGKTGLAGVGKSQSKPETSWQCATVHWQLWNLHPRGHWLWVQSICGKWYLHWKDTGCSPCHQPLNSTAQKPSHGIVQGWVLEAMLRETYVPHMLPRVLCTQDLSSAWLWCLQKAWEPTHPCGHHHWRVWGSRQTLPCRTALCSLGIGRSVSLRGPLLGDSHPRHLTTVCYHLKM